MAIVIGESGAWKQVLLMARTAGIVVSKPSDVGIQLARAQKILAEEELRARDDLALREAELERDLAQKQAAAAQDITRVHDDFGQRLKRLAAQPATSRLWTGLSRLTLQAQERAQVRALSRRALPAARALQEFLDGRETEIARRVESTRRIVLQVEAIAHSATLANAIAERNVIKALSALPDDFILMNDLHLHASRDLPFDGGYVRTAQLDHLLVGPTGIYAIETRSWSRTARIDGPEADPILQVSQASFLCTQILKEAGNTQIVRSIVASEGTAPTRSGGAHVATVPAARLLPYVQYGPQLVSVQEVAEIVRILS
ncbi:MAG: nuclease-related domain-containing protein [Candidatus Cryosericum sp.]|nr:NERD domain-containing protein [bacterium]